MPLVSLVFLYYDIVFSFFSVITYEVTSCIFVLICLNCSNSLVPFAFMLHQYIRWYNPMWVNREAINNSRQDKTIILENIVILLTSIWFYGLVPLYSLSHYIVNYYTHSFLSPLLCLNVLLHLLAVFIFE